MITACVPLIIPANYQAFRTIINDMPETFAQWQYLRSQNVAQIHSSGWETVDVEVDPHEFARYCNTTNSPRNLHSLDYFALKKTEGEKY
jgi:hypothetical protein